MATYYVDGAVGNDSNLGTSEGSGNAWATLAKATSTLVLGDTCYVKASVTYYEALTEATPGQSNNPIRYIGYSTTPGDNGQVTIDAEDTRSNCINIANYTAVMNFICIDATGIGIEGGFSDYIGIANCEVSGCGGYGITFDDYCTVNDCYVHDNANGIFWGRYCNVYNSTVLDNGSYGIYGTDVLGAVAAFCVVAGHTTYEIRGVYGLTVLNCTIDGKSPTGTHAGITCTAGATNVLNCILYNCDTGIDAANYRAPSLGGNNCFYGNTTDTNVWDPIYNPDGNVTSDPLFTDDANDDYSLAAASPCRNAGRDAGGTGMDIGALQSQDAGSSGPIIYAG